MFDRAILHLDLDAFFVSVEQLRNSQLRGKPLIIGGTGGRGVVASCSYEARQFGVHSAMPVRMALRLCPDAIVLRGDMEQYSRYSGIVTDIVEAEAPLFEKASIDEFYVDISGMDRYIGAWKWSQQLRRKIVQESGLPISAALSVNKLVSKIGVGEAKPNGEMCIDSGVEREFLAPLSTSRIPYLGKETYKKLSFMGVRTIRVLRDIPPRLLERQFGKNGVSLWRKANAIDDSPVEPFHDRKSISTERTFQEDTIDVRLLHDKLTQMVGRIAFELRQQRKLTSTVTVKIRYTDFNTYTQQRKIPYTANDRVLLRHVHELFDRLYQRRQLVRLIGVRFGDLVHGNYQIDLFDDTLEEVALLHTLDKIRKRFGKNAVMRATSLQ
jgi:DNA polymerase-4